MSNSKAIVGSAVAGLLALSMTSLASAANGPTPTPVPTSFHPEKCYGIAKAHKNDCGTATHACSGTSTKARDPDSWIYVPAGTCGKIAGGIVKPKS
jgi:uncharacterized membrane protein